MRHTAFTFTLLPLEEQRAHLRRHAGAARFAYNRELAHVKATLDARKTDASVKVPWSGFDLINDFNRFKLSAAAGVDAAGKLGLPWRGEVRQQVFEEAAVDLGKGLQHWSRQRRARSRSARRVGFPRFRKRGEHDAFRLRNQKNAIRVEPGAVCLPKLGQIRVREGTRRLRRMLRVREDGQAAARVLFATVTLKQGRWVVRLNIEANAFHPAVGAEKTAQETVGIDRGLKAFAVAAKREGYELWRDYAPKPLTAKLRRLRRLGRRLSFKKPHSRNRSVARRRLGRLHYRFANTRRAHMHALTSHIAKTHVHVSLEDLHTAGMLRNHNLARSIADSCWGLFAQQMRYKGPWYRCQISTVDRFAPTSKTCCRCDWVADKMPLKVRTFVCAACGWQADRDVNAAANCARWAHVSHVASKQDETLNVCRGSGSGRACAAKPGPLKQKGALSVTPEKGAVGYAGSVHRL